MRWKRFGIPMVCLCTMLSAGRLLAAEASDEPLLGLEAVNVPLPWFDSEKHYSSYEGSVRELQANSTVAVTSLGRPPLGAPVAVRLSRSLYLASDGHLDAIVRFDMETGDKPAGRLKVILSDSEGKTVSTRVIEAIPGSQLFFSYRFPEAMAGRSGRLNVVWDRPEGVVEASAAFEVGAVLPVARSGRVRLAIPNKTGAVLPGAPITVGVPFPKGALETTEHLRLVDAAGSEIPLQVTEGARWSRFGSVKWAHCNFTANLEGKPGEVFLEYGPDIRRKDREALLIESGKGFPSVNAGRLKLNSEGVWFDPKAEGVYQKVLASGALEGAFVQRTRGANYAGTGHTHFLTEGQLYTMNRSAPYTVEEDGPEKAVIRTEGWYVNAESGDRFCQYVARYVVFRNSPVLRIFYTWIFTGDGNRDTIRTMGWKFPLAEIKPAGFLSSFEEGKWLKGYYLRQHDHDEYALFDYASRPGDRRMVWKDAVPERPLKEIGKGRRAPGIMAAEGRQMGVYIGVQDFWQNFPASLRQESEALTFHLWPRYGRERLHPVHAGDEGNIWRLWFAHEGETLNFSLPPALTENPLYKTESRSEPHFSHGQPDSVNAQGIAKTSEIWLYFAPETGSRENSTRVMEGLQTESIRAIVDPRWMAASGAFGKIAAANREKYPALETAFREAMLGPVRQVDRMGVYGKWIYGDLLRTANLDTQEGKLYRTFRKSHWGWPYSWLQFARSGDPDYLRFAQAATRMMTDTAFCHYVDDGLAEYFSTQLAPRQLWTLQQPFRAIGWHNRNLIPWAGYWGPSTRCYVDKVDYLWDAWHLSGYHRARDVAMKWAEQTKLEEPDKLMRGPITAAENAARWAANLQKQYLEMYEATWDPWFLAGAQALADLHLWRYREEGYPGHFWLAGNIAWHQYSSSREHEAVILKHAAHWADMHQFGWGTTPTTILAAAAYGHDLTGDDYYLRRAAGVVDTLRWAIYCADEPGYYRGFYVFDDASSDLLFKSWLQLWFPWVMERFERAGGEPKNPIGPPFDQEFGGQDHIAVRKRANEALPLRVKGGFRIIGPDGALHREGNAPAITLAAEAPEGVYRIFLTGRKRLPISPPDTPEVFVPGDERKVKGSDLLTQHWFRVPEGTRSFSIEFDNSRKPEQSVRQIVIWNPDGKEAWAHRELAVHHDPNKKTIRAFVNVAPEEAGRLWRVTLPGRVRNPGFQLGPELPPYLSHDAARWFNPASNALNKNEHLH